MLILPVDHSFDDSAQARVIGAGTCGLCAAFAAKENSAGVAGSYSRRRPKALEVGRSSMSKDPIVVAGMARTPRAISEVIEQECSIPPDEIALLFKMLDVVFQ